MAIKRVSVIVLDGVGIGEAPDAADYGDVGSNSIGNTARAVGGLHLPHMGAMGIGRVTNIEGVPPDEGQPTQGAYGKCRPKNAGKDTVAGHWEMMGIYLPVAFPLYPHGFPPDVIDEFTRKIGRGILANKPASGTEIIQEYGVEHMKTGKPIVYTSGDSVFQIAMHEDIIPIDEQYRISEIAREMLTGKHAVGRVITRPFIGTKPGEFERTAHRRDYPLLPQKPTIMDKLIVAGRDVVSVGKIDDIFGHRGITKGNHTPNNAESTDALIKFLDEPFEGLLFANLIEFDMIYGHRNDPRGYANALEAFDARIPDIRAHMTDSDIAIITGDHGVDPTTPGTDHTREFVPLLVFGPPVAENVNLGTRGSLADIGATIADIFGLEPPEIGVSFLNDLLRLNR